MQTLRLNINDGIYDSILQYLQKFDKSQLEIINDNQTFLSIQKSLQSDLDEINSGSAEFVSLDELNDSINKRISRYEN